MERDVGEVGSGKFGFIARDRFGDAVCLVVKDEREQVVASLAAAVTALVDEELSSLVNGTPNGMDKKIAGGLPQHLEVA